MHIQDSGKVAILLSTYNGARYLDAQLQSLIQQTYQNWYCYIRDDGSKDQSVEIIQKYVSSDSRFIYISDALGNLGYNSSYYHLIKHTEESYISFCDQDDVWHLDKLEKSLIKLQEIETSERTPALVHTNSVFVDERLQVIRPEFLQKRAMRKGLNAILFANCVQGSSIMLNRNLANLAMNAHPKLPCDYHLGIIAELAGARGYIHETLHQYRQHSSSMIAVGDSQMKENAHPTISASLKLSLSVYAHLTNDFTNIEISNPKSRKSLREYYYLFEGRNPLKKLYIAIKNFYPFYSKKDYIRFLLLIIRNKNLLDATYKGVI